MGVIDDSRFRCLCQRLYRYISDGHDIHGRISLSFQMIHLVASAEVGYCIDRYGEAPTRIYNLRSCTLCYVYLFPEGKTLGPAGPNYEYLSPISNAALVNVSSIDAETYNTVTSPIESDVLNETAWRAVCSTLNGDECTRWKACCRSAQACCARQLKMPDEVPAGYCHRTWDGWGCWGDTPPDSYGYNQCPDFIEHSMTTRETICFRIHSA